MSTLTLALVLSAWLAGIVPFYDLSRHALRHEKGLFGRELHDAAFADALLWPVTLFKRLLDVEKR